MKKINFKSFSRKYSFSMLSVYATVFSGLFLLPSCSIYMEIPEDKFKNADEAIRMVERVMRSQGEVFAPTALSVTEEYIGYSKEKHVSRYGWGRANTGSTVAFSNNIYFDLIKSIQLYKKKAHYEIRITTTASRQTHVIFSWDKNLAQDGARAIVFLQQNATGRR